MAGTHGHVTWSDWTALCSVQVLTGHGGRKGHRVCQQPGAGSVLSASHAVTHHPSPNHLWSMCYSFPHSRQFHFDRGWCLYSKLEPIMKGLDCVGLGNRDLFGWLRRLSPRLLGEFLARLFRCLDLRGLARTGFLPHSLYSCWACTPMSSLPVLSGVHPSASCSSSSQSPAHGVPPPPGWGSGLFGPWAQEPHKGKGNVTASAPAALSTDLWTNIAVM